VHFDDRLATVLRHRAEGGTITRIQYRQILDLLGTIPHDANGPQVEAAYARLAQLASRIPAAERAAMLGEAGMRLRSPRLIAVLAQNDLPVASAAIRTARLSEEEWLDLAPALPIHVRSLMRDRSDLGPKVEELMVRLGIRNRGLPPAGAFISKEAPARAMATAPANAPQVHELRPVAENVRVPEQLRVPEQPDGIGAIVRRIEEFRKARQVTDGVAPPSDSPFLPLGDGANGPASAPLRSFDFATDSEARITWASHAVAPMVVGLRLSSDDAARAAFTTSPAFAAALRRRQPLRRERGAMIGAPAISGEWIVDASPRFERASGRFTGYIGRMRRPAEAPAPTVVPAAAEADQMRQLLHELRTPVNAIQGFAEVIQQQLFGPTPHEYRALAASIVGDAARILAGFEDLDRLARLETGVMRLDPGISDLAPLLTQTVARIEPFSGPRGSGFALRIEDAPLDVTMADRDVERLLWRVLATLAAAAEPGEVLKLRARPREGMARVSLQLPASLAAQSDAELFSASVPPATQALSAGMFGGGFALRLAASEARAAGGALNRKDDRLRLVLPSALATPSTDHGQDHDARDA